MSYQFLPDQLRTPKTLLNVPHRLVEKDDLHVGITSPANTVLVSNFGQRARLGRNPDASECAFQFGDPVVKCSGRRVVFGNPPLQRLDPLPGSR